MDGHLIQTVRTGNCMLQPHEIAHIRQEINTREQSIAALISQCETLKGLLSPLRRQLLPPEVLGEVFHHALQVDFDSNRECTIDEQLRDICLVCRAWRQVALTTPRLWCTVEGFPLAARAPSNFDRLEAWLMRAGSLPKTLELVESDHGDEEREYDEESSDDDEHVIIMGDIIREAAPCPLKDASLATFLSQGPRLERVVLICHSMRCLQDLLDKVGAVAAESPFGSISSLELRVEDGFWNDDDSPRVDIFRRLPQSLTELQLDLPCFLDIVDEDWVPLPIAFADLTTLEFSMAYWPTHWILLCAVSCPRLQTLVIDLFHSDADWDTVGPWAESAQLKTYTLPSLNTLRLRHFLERHSTTRVLRYLCTPCLAELDISFDCPRSDLEADEDMHRDPGFEDFASDLHTLMKNSTCTNTLRRARIHALVLPWATLQSVLEALNPVTDLVLDGVWSPEPWPIWPHTLLPFLQSLEILVVDDSFDYQSIFSVVQGRSDKVSSLEDRLQRLKISMFRKPTFIHPNDCAAAVKLRQSGVEVEVALENPVDVWSRSILKKME